jgi:hypothetical protein
MAEEASATSWVVQSPERVTAVERRRKMLVRETAEDHFRRLVLKWAEGDEGAFPSRAQASSAAQYELEVLCRWLGRLGALEPHEVFPRQAPVTASQDELEGW